MRALSEVASPSQFARHRGQTFPFSDFLSGPSWPPDSAHRCSDISSRRMPNRYLLGVASMRRSTNFGRTWPMNVLVAMPKACGHRRPLHRAVIVLNRFVVGGRRSGGSLSLGPSCDGHAKVVFDDPVVRRGSIRMVLAGQLHNVFCICQLIANVYMVDHVLLPTAENRNPPRQMAELLLLTGPSRVCLQLKFG